MSGKEMVGAILIGTEFLLPHFNRLTLALVPFLCGSVGVSFFTTVRPAQFFFSTRRFPGDTAYNRWPFPPTPSPYSFQPALNPSSTPSPDPATFAPLGNPASPWSSPRYYGFFPTSPADRHLIELRPSSLPTPLQPFFEAPFVHSPSRPAPALWRSLKHHPRSPPQFSSSPRNRTVFAPRFRSTPCVKFLDRMVAVEVRVFYFDRFLGSRSTDGDLSEGVGNPPVSLRTLSTFSSSGFFSLQLAVRQNWSELTFLEGVNFSPTGASGGRTAFCASSRRLFLVFPTPRSLHWQLAMYFALLLTVSPRGVPRAVRF